MDVVEYEFKPLNGANPHQEDTGQSFEFKNFDIFEDNKRAQAHDKIIRKERNALKNSSFQLSPIVREYRGHKAQSDLETESEINEEVERRVQKIYEEAHQKGFEMGFAQGKEEILQKMQDDVNEKTIEFANYLEEARMQYSVMTEKQKEEIYFLVKNLSKWIILRELDEDGDYVRRLLEKLIMEMKETSELLIQVSSETVKRMPEVIEQVSQKLGELKNVRVEVDHEIHDQGIIVSSDNGIINGTLEQQFKALDKLFTSVGLPNA